MKWDIIKKNFRLSININLTSTKIMAWALFIAMCIFTSKIPHESKAYFIMSMSTIITFLYTGKMVQESYNKYKQDNTNL